MRREIVLTEIWDNITASLIQRSMSLSINKTNLQVSHP